MGNALCLFHRFYPFYLFYPFYPFYPFYLFYPFPFLPLAIASAYVENALLDLLRAALVPELGADVAAGAARYVEL